MSLDPFHSQTYSTPRISTLAFQFTLFKPHWSGRLGVYNTHMLFVLYKYERIIILCETDVLRYCYFY